MYELKDINTNMYKNLVNDSVSNVSNKRAIAQIILNLLQTNTLEIPFKEWQGSGLSALLGEACSNITAAVIVEQIKFLISTYIKYIELDDVTYRIDYDHQTYLIFLKYHFVSEATVIEQTVTLSTTI